MVKVLKFKMKTYNTLNVFHFCIGASCLLITFLCCLFFLNYENHRKIRASYSYSDLQTQYCVIEDENAYELIQQVFLDTSTIDSMQMQNINCFTLQHSYALKSFIKNTSDDLISQTDKKIMRQQLNNTIYLWNNEKLKNARCLISKDYYKLNQNDSIDYWVKFRANFGYGGDSSFSNPIFNKDKSLAVMEFIGQGDWLVATNDILLFRKENGKWILVKQQNLWVS